MSDEAGQKPKYAIVPECLIMSGLDEGCIRLFAYLDLRQGARGWPVRGFDFVAAKTGSDPRTVATHARHLAEAGVIELTGDPKPPYKRFVMKIIHNPARGQASETVDIPPVESRPSRQSKAAARFQANEGRPVPQGLRLDDNGGARRVPQGVPVRTSTSTAPDAGGHLQDVWVSDSTCDASDAVRPRSERCWGEGKGEQENIHLVLETGQCRKCQGWPGPEAPAGAIFCTCDPPDLAESMGHGWPANPNDYDDELPADHDYYHQVEPVEDDDPDEIEPAEWVWSDLQQSTSDLVASGSR